MPVPTPLPEPLRRGPFTLAEAERWGFSRKMLGGRRFKRLFRGVYVGSETELTLAVRTRVALRVAPPGAVVTQATGLRIYGAQIADPSVVHLESIHPHPGPS